MSGLEIKYRMPGLAKLQKQLALAPGAFANRNAIALNRSLDALAEVIRPRINIGPGHFGYHARDRIQTHVESSVSRIGTMKGKLTTDAPQLRWAEYGTKAHDILPRKDAAVKIRFKGGEWVGEFAVVHNPGEKARHTFRRALTQTKPLIGQIFADATRELAMTLANEGKE